MVAEEPEARLVGEGRRVSWAAKEKTCRRGAAWKGFRKGKPSGTEKSISAGEKK